MSSKSVGRAQTRQRMLCRFRRIFPASQNGNNHLIPTPALGIAELTV
jgi:hypothetical protein